MVDPSDNGNDGFNEHAQKIDFEQDFPDDTAKSKKTGNPADFLGVGHLNKDLKQQIADLEIELEQAKNLAEEHKDKMVRAYAEIENVRRKALRDIEHARKYSAESLLKELLPVIDSLGHALGLADNAEPAMLEGLQLTEKILLDTLQKFGVVQFDPKGELFNPDSHEALSVVPRADSEPNLILTVVQKGYRLHDRVIRPARVIVAKAL